MYIQKQGIHARIYCAGYLYLVWEQHRKSRGKTKRLTTRVISKAMILIAI